FFGEKYGDMVRVVEISDSPTRRVSEGGAEPSLTGRAGDALFSREFCGGTHLEHTGQIGFFKIVGEEAVGKGVRRLTCVTAKEAVKTVQAEDAVLAALTNRFRCRPTELPAKVEALEEQIKKLQQQIKKGATMD